MANNRLVVEVNYLDDAGVAKTMCFSPASIVPEGGAGTPFAAYPIVQPRVAANPRFRLQAAGGIVDGTSALELVNEDHALDAFYAYSFDGRYIKFILELAVPAWAGGGFNTFTFYGLLEQPEFTDSRVILKYRPVANSRMEGRWPFRTFDGTGGLNGNADLAGKVKPQLWGKAKQIPLVSVDPANLIYWVTDYTDVGLSGSVQAVYDAGVALTAGANYVSTADMTANAPAAGQYRVLPKASATPMFVRLGSSPTGLVTCDATLGTATCKLGDIIDYMIRYGITQGQFGGGQAALNALAGGEPVGVYLDAEAAGKDVLAQMVAGIHGWFAPDDSSSLANVHVRWPMEPSTVSDYVLPKLPAIDGAVIVKSGRSSSMPDNFPPLPAVKIQLDYERVWAVQTSGLAGSVSATMRSYLATEYRRTSVDASAPIPARYPTGPWITSPSVWVPASTANMTTEANRQRDTFGVRRDFLQIRCPVDVYAWTRNRLGDPVDIVNFARYGCEVSRTFMVVGYDIDMLTGMADLLLWG